jgi:Flavin containing amine oxidoreductase/FAD binding domain
LNFVTNIFRTTLLLEISCINFQLLQFAGEASHCDYFSTVHGAIESGWREADRILSKPRKTALTNSIKKFDVIIIGAGMAGLGAARTLCQAGRTNFTILEGSFCTNVANLISKLFDIAQNYAGGRACTVRWGDGSTFVENGAQWIHGEHGNPLYKFAQQHNLLSDILSEEGLGTIHLKSLEQLVTLPVF